MGPKIQSDQPISGPHPHPGPLKKSRDRVAGSGARVASDDDGDGDDDDRKPEASLIALAANESKPNGRFDCCQRLIAGILNLTRYFPFLQPRQ